jgi:hypothetical protein
MKILEKINEKRIELISSLTPRIKSYEIRSILVFTYGGLGNIQMMFGLFEKIKNFDVTIVYKREDIKEFVSLYYAFKFVTINEITGSYDVCICNFLNLQKQIIKKIISLKIPYRIAHEGKFKNVFDKLIPFSDNESEINQNSNLWNQQL